MVVTVRAGTPTQVARFDRNTQSLILPDARDAVADYELPVVYEADRYVTFDGYPAWRLLPPDQCAVARKSRVTDVIPRGGGCLIEVPGRPKGQLVTFAVREGTVGGTGGFGTRTTTVVAESGGRVVASALVGVVTDRLSLIPWAYFGFFFVDAPYSGSPFRGMLWRDAVTVGHVGDAIKSPVILRAAAVMLGLRRRLADGTIPPVKDLDTLLAPLPPKAAWMIAITQDPLLAAFVADLDRAAVQTIVVKPGNWAVNQLEVVVDGAERPTPRMYAHVLESHAKLAPLRDRMIQSLNAWENAGVVETNGWVELVQDVLAKMPAADGHGSQ